MSEESAEGDGSARRGRPRKWASEAERKRAYRARKADELAEPERLRAELRDARSEVRRLEKECARRERLVGMAERRLAKETRERKELEAKIVQQDNVVAFWENRARIAERRLWDLHHPGDSSE
ncbi:hypothetical protein [Rhabdothermincola salaria]|uniref:hypothetical protein n=1 Tax=Rhabdothermincola salaria TaxID=2903142 RepID=UPI001E5EDE6A|nr:hypothetical protein [Rhabdothermincola salaria]MCD9625625.1 hypothetical protein [Rhabdothermincola salaria]